MVYRLQLTGDETIDILDAKHIAVSTVGYTLLPGVYEIRDINLMLTSLLPGEVEVNVTIDEIRLKSFLNNIETSRFPKKSRFYGITHGIIG